MRRLLIAPIWRRRVAMLLLLAAAGVVLGLSAGRTGASESLTHLLLVVPDDAREDDVHVLAWRDAAAEIGFALEVMSASRLVREDTLHRDAGLILPDTVHRRMNDALLAHLTRRVHDGAPLLLIHDAGVADLRGSYHPMQSRLSALAGVRYALYGDAKEGMLRDEVAWVDARALPLIRVPPGKLIRQGSDNPLTSAQPAPQGGEQLTVVGYQYGRLRYPVFATAGAFEGRQLMGGDGGSVLAGMRRAGRGVVLFVNLPLTYLKLRTDGFFMHAFLRMFAQDVMHLPQLSPLPKARGALIMNWHIDSAAALPAMEKLSALGVFEQGPYSVHLTAGPDVDTPGDGGGMDLATTSTMRAWVRRFAERGDEVGSHGGWIHNEFGRLISSQRPARSTDLIERNSAVVSQASGKVVREYSAPTGTHPAWVTPWLREHGIQAYYFTGDIGMAPTRSYQDGARGPSDMWAFPVLSFGIHAAFEEASAAAVPEAQLGAWLNDVADFCATDRTIRLVYFHPPGLVIFPRAVESWFDHAGGLVREGRLGWMTMAHYAEFANRRLQVQWQWHAESSGWRLEASHPHSLAEMTWLLPAQRFERPAVTLGQAQVVREGAYWRVTAEGGNRLELALRSVALMSSASSAPDPLFAWTPDGR